jgi:hypothetical protein
MMARWESGSTAISKVIRRAVYASQVSSRGHRPSATRRPTPPTFARSALRRPRKSGPRSLAPFSSDPGSAIPDLPPPPFTPKWRNNPSMKSPFPTEIAGMLSFGSGLALFTAPRTMARIYGLPDRSMVCRAFGARDIVIGLGLLQARRPSAWWLARTLADALDVGLIARNGRLAGRRRPRDWARVLIGLLLAGTDAFMTLRTHHGGVASRKMW